jgi:hypothetical protein
MERPQRAWTCIAQYPGKKKFRFGTVMAGREESEARPAMEAALMEVMPTVPAILAMEPGAVFFMPEER